MIQVSILTMGGIAVAIGLILVVADKIFRTEEDPRLKLIEEILPGVNCGACGYPGCAGYAKALIDHEEDKIWCAPGGPDTNRRIAELLGVKTEEVKRTAVVQCQGGTGVSKDVASYGGVRDCSAALLLASGNKMCDWGCLGFGTCAELCIFGAISMHSGIPVVDKNRCTGCGICVKTCPKKIFALKPRDQRVHLACLNMDRGKAVKEICSKGCFTCMICVSPKVNKSGAVQMKDNLPVIINPSAEDFEEIARKCPAGCYVIR